MDLQNHLKTSTAFKFETERFKTNLKYRNKGSAEHWLKEVGVKGHL